MLCLNYLKSMVWKPRCYTRLFQSSCMHGEEEMGLGMRLDGGYGPTMPPPPPPPFWIHPWVGRKAQSTTWLLGHIPEPIKQQLLHLSFLTLIFAWGSVWVQFLSIYKLPLSNFGMQYFVHMSLSYPPVLPKNLQKDLYVPIQTCQCYSDMCFPQEHSLSNIPCGTSL